MKVENQKKKNNNYKSPNDINIISPLSALESRKVLYFQKIESLNNINTFGSQPVIVYKKSSKPNNNHNPKSPSHFLQKNVNKYISDGNLGKKLQKLNSSSNIQYHANKNIKIKKTKSFSENIVLIEQNDKKKEEKEKIRNIKEQKLFSQTVRQSNMRPVFPKNKNKQFNLTKTGFNKNNKSNEIEKTNNINKEKKNEKENSKEKEMKKNKIMNQLVENAVAIEIKKYKNNKPSKETIKNNKKREYLEENGITTSKEEITENENKNPNESNNENNQEKEKKSQNIIIPKHNNFISPEDLIQNNSHNKTKNKPIIEQFEYLLKIKEEQKKIISTQKKEASFNKYINSNYISNRVNPAIYDFSHQIENSFRKKNMGIFEEKIKITNDINENSSSYSLEDKRNHRSTKEINEYLREKKLKYKQNEESKQLEKNKKLFLRFKNLYNLNMKDITDIDKINNQHLQINHKQKKLRINNNQIEERKDNFNCYPINNKIYNYNSYLDNKIPNQNNNIRKKKEINEYYIGNDSTIKNNNSTVVDANEYYLNILESQQLLVNSKLKKINNETETNQNLNIQENIEKNKDEDKDYNDINVNVDINNKNNIVINELNVSKEQIRKITDKEKTKTSNSKKTEEILNTNSIEELKQKIDTTLKRANLFFSKEVIENYKSNILNNLSEYTDLNNNITGNSQISSNNNNKISNNNEENKEEISKKENENELNEKTDKFENKLINNYLNEEDKQKSSEIKIETSDSNKIQSNKKNIFDIDLEDSDGNIFKEKEKNITSLSHTYNNSTNPNKKIKIAIEPRAVLNLVEILKFIIQRKIFVMLYESYINHAIYQQYNIAFSFFVAICKQYPFKKLEEYYNYKTYNYAFRQLFRPFNRRNFKYFLSRFHDKKKIEYLVALLSKMIKFKTLERIYIYGQYFQEDDEEKAFKMIILKIIYTLIRPHLYEAFIIFRNNIYQSIDNKNEEKDDSEVNFNISDEDENISIDNNFINLKNEKYIDNNINDNLNSKENIKEIKNKESIIDEKSKKDINDINEQKKKDNDENNISSNSIKNHRRKNDSSLKMNSFLYESLESEEKSSISVEPNSLDNDKLHQLKMMLIAKNKNFENGIDDNYMNDDIDLELNNSLKKSEKSLQELMNIKSGKNASKTLSDMMEDNSFQKSPNQNSIDDLKKTLSNKIFNNSNNERKNKYNEENNSNSKDNSINSFGFKEKSNNEKNEEIKMINETKDTKEITDDSNTININTNNKSDTKSSEIKNNEKYLDKKINNNEEANIVQNIEKKIIDEIKNNKKEENKENNINEGNKKNVIEMEYNIPKNNLKSRLLKNYKIIEDNNEQNEECKNNENDKIIIPEKKTIKIPLIKIINDSNDSDNKNSKEDSKSKEIQPKNKLSSIFENQEQFTEELINEIMNKIIFSEIKNPKTKLLPNKKYKFEKFLKKAINNNNSSQSQNNSLTNSCNSAGNFRDSHKSSSHSLNKLSLHEDVFSLNDSLNSNYSVYSVFNKTIKDKKKEHSLNLYFNNICPKLIAYLHKEIIKKYPRIYENISLQKKNISEKLMISLVLQDAQMLRSNYKKLFYKERLDRIIDKKEMLKKFSAINKKIRQEDNITSDNYYDNMINECILETAIELIEKERFYGDNGEPLKWSSRTREISFKYGKNDAKKFADYICKNILKIIHNRIGLINDNYSYMNQDELNYEREKRLLDTIKNDLNRNESQWKNLEMEETQLKVESTEMILDQLYNEVIEILEHIQFNRASPELYQYKSIYACEEIPKLSFQQTTTEDMRIPEGEDNDFMNL